MIVVYPAMLLDAVHTQDCPLLADVLTLLNRTPAAGYFDVEAFEAKSTKAPTAAGVRFDLEPFGTVAALWI